MDQLITIKLTLEQYEALKEAYLPYAIDANGEYIDFVANYDDVIITGYISRHTYRKVTFKGTNASNEALRWIDELPEVERKKTTPPTKWIDLNEQIGSDEVGVGDFLLPMIVVATHIKKSDVKKLKELGVDDSKKMSDEKIREIGPIVKKSFKHCVITISNEKYNSSTANGLNINSLKAKMHNYALATLLKRKPNLERVFVDQFCTVKSYYSYLDEKDEPIVRNITFQTKGESYYPSVALASVIARYHFLLKRDELSEKYKIDFPFGASSRVDKVAKELLEKVGKEEFDKLVKKNFKNYQRVIDEKEKLV